MIAFLCSIGVGFSLIFFFEKRKKGMSLSEGLFLAFGLGISVMILLGRILFS